MSDRIENEQKRKEEIKASLGTAERALNLKPHIDAIVNFGMRQHDNAMTQVLISRESRNTVATLRNSVDPTTMPKGIVESAKIQAESYIEDKNEATMDVKDFGAFNALTYDEDLAGNDLREARLNKQKLLYEYDKNNLENSLSSDSNEDKKRFLNNMGLGGIKAGSEIVKECIPCGMRPLSWDDIKVSGPDLEKTWKDLIKKYKDLQKKLQNLSFNEFETDLCDLMRFLDTQCVPDLFALLSLLGLMMAKYTDVSFTSWNNVLNSLISPFLAPIFAPLVVNLDKYLNTIIDPLVCVVDSLEFQLGKLDVVGGYNSAQEQRRQYNESKIEFYERKNRVLAKRKNDIIKEVNARGEMGEDFNTANFPQYTAVNPLDGSDVNLDKGLPMGSSWRTTYVEEATNIQKEIEKNKQEILKLQTTNKSIKNNDNQLMNDTRKSLNNAREKLEDTKEYLKQMVAGLVNVGNQGIDMVRATFEMYRTELERVIMGRISTQEDQIELARSIQKIQRYISIINAIMKLRKTGKLFDKCKAKDGGSKAMGDFVAAYKSEPDGGNFNFYQATDNLGNDLMVIAPGGTKLNVTGLELEDTGNDELFNQATIKDVQTVATFNDLNEAHEMNKQGVLLNIGNISGKDISVQLPDAKQKKSSLDYKVESSYVIIKNDFCSKSPYNFGSSETVKNWIKTL